MQLDHDEVMQMSATRLCAPEVVYSAKRLKVHTVKDVAMHVHSALVIAHGLLAGRHPPPQLWGVVLWLLTQLFKQLKSLHRYVQHLSSCSCAVTTAWMCAGAIDVRVFKPLLEVTRACH